MNKPLVIIGAGSIGGHIGYNLAEYQLEAYRLMGFLDDDTNKIGKDFCGFPVLGAVEHIVNLPKDVSVIVGVAFPQMKKHIMDRLDTLGTFEYPPLIAKSAWISNNVQVDEGAIIYPGTTINYGTIVRKFAVLNMNCAVGHDCEIGAYSSLAPGVNLAGHTKLGLCVDMGIGSATIQDVRIGNNCVVGGQSMLIKNLPDNSKAVGIPARPL